MAKEVPSTSMHRGPVRQSSARRRPALVCAFPKPIAVALPDSGTVIGRAWLEALGLADREISGAHLRIDRAGGRLRVADVGSRNGTWIDGNRLCPHELVALDDGALLRIGKTIFVARTGLLGPFGPMAAIGGLVGPFGLRGVGEAISSLRTGQPDTILIEGETGVGKELAARAVATALGRSAPFAAVNVPGVAAGVFESQMFGHVAGAFSGAGAATAGIFAAHDGGTVFLDEVGELELELQAKLLRVLENREILPVGANRPTALDVLVIAATNRALDAMVEQGAFRRDLLMRLVKARLRIPALRERIEDLFWIAAELARRAGTELAAEQVEVEAMERLLLEPWPGNVRELDAALAAARRLDAAPGLRLWTLEQLLGSRPADATAGPLTEQRVEAAILARHGNVSAAAMDLGVSRGKLLRLRKRSREPRS